MHVHTVMRGLPETYFPMFIANGVTCVRDMAADLGLLKQLRKDINDGKLLGPHIIGGPMVDGPIPIWPGVSISISDESGATRSKPIRKHQQH